MFGRILPSFANQPKFWYYASIINVTKYDEKHFWRIDFYPRKIALAQRFRYMCMIGQKISKKKIQFILALFWLNKKYDGYLKFQKIFKHLKIDLHALQKNNNIKGDLRAYFRIINSLNIFETFINMFALLEHSFFYNITSKKMRICII